MAAETKRYDGMSAEVKAYVAKNKADKAGLIDWLKRRDELIAESESLAGLAESLPGEIDGILASGYMDTGTIEKLARQRATLDLLPARQEKIDAALDGLDAEFENVRASVAAVVDKAEELYSDCQTEAAVADLQQLGVSEEIAKQQALLREDINAIQPRFWGHMEPNDRKARALLWRYESFEAGYHFRSEEAAKFKKRWLPAN